MRQTHEIDLYEEFADAVSSGDRCFEIRYNNRGYQKGDIVRFKVIDCLGLGIYHVLNNKEFEITYVLQGRGLKEDYVAFGIKEIASADEREGKEEGKQ